MTKTKNNPDSLADYFADIITSKHNQHVIILIVGAAGTGKSWGGIDLASEIAKSVSERVGGEPKDYYDFEKHLAVMSKDEVKRVMTKPGQYAIIHIDDAGVPLNSRKWQSDENIDFNSVLQTFRPNHNAVIITAQAGMLIDKVIRSIAHYIIEMDKNIFDLGISIAKVKHVKYNHQLGRPLYPFISINGNTYLNHIFEKPSKELTDRYEIIRAEQLKKLQESKEADDKGKSKASNKKSDILFDVWVTLKEQGFSLREIGRMTHTDHAHIKTTLDKAGVVV